MSDGPLIQPLADAVGQITHGKLVVQDRDSGTLVPLRPRLAQARILEAMLTQAAAGQPVRLIVPKFRRGGVSTLVQAVIRELCASIPNSQAGTFAHTDADTAAIFRLAKGLHQRAGGRTGDASNVIEFANGSRYECRTARSTGVMRGSGLTFLHITELAYLQTIQALDAAAITALLNTVPDAPHTLIVIEGTGEGPTGEFWRRCLEARDNPTGPYRLCFLPWFDDPAFAREPSADFVLDGEEVLLKVYHQLSDRQLAWRRWKTAQHSTPAHFKREFPATLDECFEAASGRVYPAFEPSRHVKRIKLDETWVRYRAMDWGFATSPFVCLWVAFQPSGDPGLTIDPGCRQLKREMLAYRYNAQTDRPLAEDDHGPSALRYLVTTYRLFGRVHVYREFYRHESPLSDCCEEVHRLSGWELPGGADPAVLGNWRRGTGEAYAGGVADRSQPGSISQFRQWGVSPLIGQVRFARSRTAGEGQSRGEVQDGIEVVHQLIAGGADFFAHFADRGEQINERVQRAARDRTGLWLEDEELRTLREWRQEHSPEPSGYDPSAEHGMVD